MIICKCDKKSTLNAELYNNGPNVCKCDECPFKIVFTNNGFPNYDLMIKLLGSPPRNKCKKMFKHWLVAKM